jgi:peptidyl-prolyl cis-trans isomerase D
MVSARVVQHHPSARKPLAEVKDQVRAQLVATEAAKLAKAEGEKLLAALKADPKAEPEKFSAPATITRAAPGELAPPVVTEVFKLPTEPLPVLTGVDLGAGGYQLIRLEKAEAPDASAEERRQMYQDQIQQVLAQTAVSAYVAEVKSRRSIERKLPQ